MLNKILTVVYLLIGLYFIYAGATKKGRIYENPNVTEDKKDMFKKDMSLFMIISGPVLCIGSALELIKANPILYAVCYTLVILFALVLLIRIRPYMKKG